MAIKKPPAMRLAATTRPRRIQRTPGVCGGDPCIAETRIPVWVLYQARQFGASDTKLLRMYPGLKRTDLKHAWQYVLAGRHQAAGKEELIVACLDEDHVAVLQHDVFRAERQWGARP